MKQNTSVPLPKQPAEDKLRSAFSDVYFLIICILVSVKAVFGLVLSPGIDLTVILFAVGLWLTYAHYAAKKPTLKKPCGLRIISGTALATRIINWVALVPLSFAAVQCTLSIFNRDMAIFTYDCICRLVDYHGVNYSLYLNLIRQLPIYTALVCYSATVFAAIIIIVVLNICFYRPLRRLTKSVGASGEKGKVDPKCVRRVRMWLFALGIVMGVGALLSGLRSFLPEAAGAAACILAALWMRKYFEQPEP